MLEDPLQRIQGALNNLNDALDALRRDDKQEAKDRIEDAMRKLRRAHEALGDK